MTLFETLKKAMGPKEERDWDAVNKENKIIAHKKEIDDMIGYAIHEGFIGDDAEYWTDEEKEKYYFKCMDYDPPDEEQ